jgi:hypothetical protein
MKKSKDSKSWLECAEKGIFAHLVRMYNIVVIMKNVMDLS